MGRTVFRDLDKQARFVISVLEQVLLEELHAALGRDRIAMSCLPLLGNFKDRCARRATHARDPGLR